MPMLTTGQTVDITNRFYGAFRNDPYLLSRVVVYLFIKGPVVPGEPIPISISFYTYNRRLDLGRDCSARVFLGN